MRACGKKNLLTFAEIFHFKPKEEMKLKKVLMAALMMFSTTAMVAQMQNAVLWSFFELIILLFKKMLQITGSETLIISGDKSKIPQGHWGLTESYDFGECFPCELIRFVDFINSIDDLS